MVSRTPALTPTAVARLVHIRDSIAERIVRLERSLERAHRDLAAVEECIDIQPDPPRRPTERARHE